MFKPPYSPQELKAAADALDRSKMTPERVMRYNKELNKKFPLEGKDIEELIARHFRLKPKEYKKSPQKESLRLKFFEEFFLEERKIIQRTFEVSDVEACAIMLDKYVSMLPKVSK